MCSGSEFLLRTNTIVSSELSMGWVDPWVGLVGLGQSADGLGLIGSHKMDPWTSLSLFVVNGCDDTIDNTMALTVAGDRRTGDHVEQCGCFLFILALPTQPCHVHDPPCQLLRCMRQISVIKRSSVRLSVRLSVCRFLCASRSYSINCVS